MKMNVNQLLFKQYSLKEPHKSSQVYRVTLIIMKTSVLISEIIFTFIISAKGNQLITVTNITFHLLLCFQN